MATQVQLRRGTSTENNAFTGAQGELTFDTTNKRVRVHDGATAGGFEIKTEDSSGNTLFADNEKAIFGAGSDLQIYHNAGTSFITESGPSNLKIGGENLYLQNTAHNENYLEAIANQGVTIYYNNAAKLATTSTGIDVTGTVTADGLTVDGNIGVNRTATGQAGFTIIDVGGAAVSGLLDLRQNDVRQTRIYNSSSDTIIRNDGGDIYLQPDETTAIRIQDGGDISFYEDTGTTAKFFWDASAESLGIGTSSLSSYSVQDLVIANTGNNVGITIQSDTAGMGKIHFADGTTGSELYRGVVRYQHSSDTMDFWTGGVAKMTIDSSGNVGIGNTSSGYVFTSGETRLAVGDGSEHAAIQIYSGTTKWGGLEFADDATDGTGQGRIGYYHPNNYMQFDTAGSERMRIDSSGNLLVGKTSLDFGATAGQEFRADGRVFIGSTDGAFVNRIGSDGSIIGFRKDGTTVGSIGTDATDIYIGTTDTGIRFNDAVNGVLPYNTSTGQTDATLDLGFSTVRWKDLYLSGVNYIGSSSDSDVGIDIKQANLSALITLNGRMNNSGTTTTAVQFKDGSGGSNVGSITVTSGGTSYNTSSDYRLKENVVDLTGAVDRVKQIPVHRFNFISDANKTVDGFLAHEVEDIVPEAVTGIKDAMRDEEYEVTPAVLDDDGNIVTEAVMGTRSVPDYQGIDQSKLVPLLTAALQEALTEIADLKARVTTLEG